LGGVVVSRKAGASIDWSELQPRFLGISNPSRSSASELFSSDAPIEPCGTFADNSLELIDQPASELLAEVETPIIAERDPLEMLVLLAANPNQNILILHWTDCR